MQGFLVEKPSLHRQLFWSQRPGEFVRADMNYKDDMIVFLFIDIKVYYLY